jgi:hypothetical protein
LHSFFTGDDEDYAISVFSAMTGAAAIGADFLEHEFFSQH